MEVSKMKRKVYEDSDSESMNDQLIFNSSRFLNLFFKINTSHILVIMYLTIQFY